MTHSGSYSVNAPAHRLLLALAEFQYLTLDQATLAAGFSRGSRTWVSTALKALTDHHYTALRRLGNRAEGGSGRGYWILARRGIRYLEQVPGMQHLPRIANGFDPETEDYRIRHILAVNDVLIACKRFAAETEGVVLHDLVHDLYLARTPHLVHLGDGRQTNLSGDGWAELSAFDYRYHLWFEVDRGTEDARRWKQKVEAIVRHAETLGEQRIDVVVTCPSAKRREELLRWTGEQAAAMERLAWADLFRITDRRPEEGNVWEWFTGPHFGRPFDEERLPLIHLPREALP